MHTLVASEELITQKLLALSVQHDCMAEACTVFWKNSVKCLLAATRDVLLVVGESMAAGDPARLAKSGNSLASRKLPNRRLGTAIALESRPRAGAGMRLAAGIGQPPGEGKICDEGGNSAPLLLCTFKLRVITMPLQCLCKIKFAQCIPHTKPCIHK